MTMTPQLVKALPSLYSATHNRRYKLPAQLENTYRPIKPIQAAGFYSLVSWMLRNPSVPQPRPQFAMETCTLVLLVGLLIGFPTRFLEPDLFPLLSNTDLPEDLDFTDLTMPYPYLRVMVPKGVKCIINEEQTELSSVSIACLQEGEVYKIPEAIGGEIYDLAATLGDKFGTKYVISNRFIIDEPGKTILVKATGANNDQVTLFIKNVSDLRQHKNFQMFFQLALNAALYMTQVPTEIEPPGDVQIGGPKVKGNGEVLPSLYQARFLGECRKIRALPAITGDGKGEPSYHVRPHWRRGHWRRVPHGSKFSLRRLQWIQPTPVNWGENEKV
jgi:hypothetical protein